jgi:uncharacterized protein (TIGR02217 family)
MSTFVESPRWPGCPSFGYTSDPEYRVVITRRASGVEKRNRSWLRPLLKLTVTVGPRMEAEIQELLEHWHAVGGQALGWRMKDWADFKSCQVQNTISALDQPLVELPDSSGDYQLVKRYAFGIDEDSQPVYQYRDIYKPVPGTVVLSGAGTVDYTTGIVSGSSGGTWGGEFDIPARYDSNFPIELVDQRIESVTFAIQEIRITGGSLGTGGGST